MNSSRFSLTSLRAYDPRRAWMNHTPSAARKPSRNRPRLGGRLSHHLARHLKPRSPAGEDEAALLACNFWLTPSAVSGIADDPEAVAAAIRPIRRCDSAAAYLAAHRRADAEHRRWSAAARLDRGAARTPHDAAATSTPSPSSFQRAARASARCHRIQAAAANLWRKLERRHPCASAAPRPPVSRPRARRSHRVVARAAKASGDSGDSDGEPPAALAAELGAARTMPPPSAAHLAELHSARLGMTR
jgi:hypothetical protein